MPLRDHFRPPLDDLTSWDGFHGQWPAMMVLALARKLPMGYVAAPHVHPGSMVEVDVAAFEKDGRPMPWTDSSRDGGTATAVWAMPTRDVEIDVPDEDEYEVRIYDQKRGRKLVAAIEIVSPANKDRPDSRRAFVGKCATLLKNHVSIAIVDLVTTRTANLYRELLEFLGRPDPGTEPELSAVACRYTIVDQKWRFQTWEHPLALGKPLPILPIWLDRDLAVTLDLEECYEETCRALQID